MSSFSLFPTQLYELAQRVVEHAKRKGDRIAVAESCTGGLIGANLTAVPGSSAAFKGGLIVYDNALKTLLLGISRAVMMEHGAVSEYVAISMANRVRECLDAEVGLAATGIAGPGGGSAPKPVGTVFVAISTLSGPTVCRRLQLTGERESIRLDTVQALFTMYLNLRDKDEL